MKKKCSIILVSVFITIVSVVSVYAASTIASSSVTYNNSTSGSPSTNVSGALNDLYTKVPTTFKVGDYVKMTPTKTSFTVPKTLTGYSADQTIKPSELNLWRVIRLNSNGTIDMVSEYTSSNDIVFYGETGYQNFVGTLNYIAKQYENKKYTAYSRNIGYNGQTDYITDTSVITSTTQPLENDTNSSNITIENESKGLGDNYQTTDWSLLAIIGLKSYRVGTAEYASYYVTTRYYLVAGGSCCSWYFRIGYSDKDSNGYLSRSNIVNTSTGSKLYHNEYEVKYALRPIVTLKPRVKAASGSGTSSSPYVLS